MKRVLLGIILVLVATLIEENQAQTTITITSCTNTNIQQAINNSVAGSTIILSCGNVTTIPISQYIQITKSLTLKAINQVTFDGQNLSRLFVIATLSTYWGVFATDIVVTLQNIRLYRGTGSPFLSGQRLPCDSGGCWGGSPSGYVGKTDGAGILIGRSGTLILDRVEIDSCITLGTQIKTGDNRPPNDITYFGGGIYTSPLSNLTVVDSTFKNCQAIQGGAIFTAGGTKLVNIKNSTFINNLATGTGEAGGGSIKLHETIGIIEGSLFKDNMAEYGSAIHNLLSDLYVYNTTFSKNNCTAWGTIYIDGAGKNANQAGKIDISNSAFLENQCMDSSGGIYFCLYAPNGVNNTATLRDSKFCNNTLRSNVPWVAGAAVRYQCSGLLHISNPVFAGNKVLNISAAENPAHDTVGANLQTGQSWRLSWSGGSAPYRGSDDPNNVTYCNSLMNPNTISTLQDTTISSSSNDQNVLKAVIPWNKSITNQRIGVYVRTQVNWKWTDDAEHDVYSKDFPPAFKKSPIVSGIGIHSSLTFNKPGSYSYGSSVDPSMFGTLVVVKRVDCQLRTSKSKCNFLSQRSGFQCKWNNSACENKPPGWKIKE